MLMEEIWGLLRIERLEQHGTTKHGDATLHQTVFRLSWRNMTFMEECLWFCFCQQKLKFRALIHDHQDKFKQSKE